MVLCVVCAKVCDDVSDIKCAGSCGVMIHASCVKGDGKKVLRSNKEWKCKDCGIKGSTAGSVNSASSTSSMVTKEFILSVMEDLKKEVFEEFKSVKNEMQELSNSTQFISDKLDSSNALMEELKAQFVELKRENIELRTANEALSQEVTGLRERMREIEQYSRRNNVEVSGLPVTPGENISDVVKDVSAALGLETPEADVAAAHRVPSYKRERTPSVIIQFNNRTTRDLWISKYRQMEQLTAKKINPTFPNSRVFLNDHLSPENKKFFASLKEKGRAAGYSFIWSRDGKFFVRKAPGDRALKISSYADIEKLK